MPKYTGKTGGVRFTPYNDSKMGYLRYYYAKERSTDTFFATYDVVKRQWRLKSDHDDIVVNCHDFPSLDDLKDIIRDNLGIDRPWVVIC